MYIYTYKGAYTTHMQIYACIRKIIDLIDPEELLLHRGAWWGLEADLSEGPIPRSALPSWIPEQIRVVIWWEDRKKRFGEDHERSNSNEQEVHERRGRADRVGWESINEEACEQWWETSDQDRCELYSDHEDHEKDEGHEGHEDHENDEGHEKNEAFDHDDRDDHEGHEGHEDHESDGGHEGHEDNEAFDHEDK